MARDALWRRPWLCPMARVASRHVAGPAIFVCVRIRLLVRSGHIVPLSIQEESCMGNDLEQLFDVGELTSALREEVLTAARDLAKASGDVALQAHVDRAFEHEKRVRDLEGVYYTSRDTRAQYVDELYALDPPTDRQIRSIHGHLANTSEAAHRDPTVPVKARALLDKVLPRGVRAITGQPFVEQNRLVKDMLAELQGPSASLVKDVGLTGMVEALADLSARYDDAIQRSPATVAYTNVVAAQERAHAFLLEVVARVIGMNFDSEVPAQVEARGQVLSVLFQALETAAERRRARQAANRRRRQKEEGGEGDDTGGEGDITAG
jgi:hypothetical protein